MLAQKVSFLSFFPILPLFCSTFTISPGNGLFIACKEKSVTLVFPAIYSTQWVPETGLAGDDNSKHTLTNNLKVVFTRI